MRRLTSSSRSGHSTIPSAAEITPSMLSMLPKYSFAAATMTPMTPGRTIEKPATASVHLCAPLRSSPYEQPASAQAGVASAGCRPGFYFTSIRKAPSYASRSLADKRGRLDTALIPRMDVR